MEFESILDKKLLPDAEDTGMPAFFLDLNLDQIVEKIQSLVQVPVKKYYYSFPADKAGEAYRRAIYKDVKKESVQELLFAFSELAEKRRQAQERKQSVTLGMQMGARHLLEVAAYCDAYTYLYEGLVEAPVESEGLLSLRAFLKNYLFTQEFQEMQKEALRLREELLGFKVKLVYENEQLYVSEDTLPGSYESFLQKALGEHGAELKSPFSTLGNLDDLEQEIVLKFARRHGKHFEEVRSFYHKYREYENEILIRFSEEIAFYLSYLVFQKKMELQGLSFAAPAVEEGKDMCAGGLYDLALACNSLHTDKAVVSNDFYLAKGERFMVLTGPNQGGKTTFARSLGQLIYFTKMGLDVPADVANVHFFPELLTHFSVEESVETGRGKLMDELVRLKPMMSGESQGAFVVINELFTTAANYDACIMGKKVLEHFIAQGCRGIYVTHLKELTQAHESIVSMRAMMDEHKVQNFKICRREADESVCAMNQVNKYHLTYQQLKERLG
ncbi:MAG: hypothetical protein IJZ82_05060 [Lachnospiraceae bacterium]|nr:hypothetical protein [Lachnospiraceae bacterium]